MSSDPTPTPESTGPAAVPRGVALCGIVALSGFIVFQGPSLWGEVSSLRRELTRSQENAVIGYVGISPRPTTAAPPGDWFRVEGGDLLLWAGWHAQDGHRWFHARTGDLDRAVISESIGRDLFQGIDAPIVEVGGGPISDRIPGDHPIDGMVVGGRPCAYPVLVLDKVLVVNDEVDGTPLLILYNVRPGGGSSIFEPVIDGHRVRMGFSGYIYKGRPLLYDRSSEGLWLEDREGMVSLAGPHKGRTLRRLGRTERLSWEDWSREHPESRVVIGADRSPAPSAPATL